MHDSSLGVVEEVIKLLNHLRRIDKSLSHVVAIFWLSHLYLYL
jgi:hypothetical protein